MKRIVAYVSFLAFAAMAQESDFPIVKIKQGLLRGVKTFSIRNREFYAFLGIPYAKPPVGKLRLKVNTL